MRNNNILILRTYPCGTLPEGISYGNDVKSDEWLDSHLTEFKIEEDELKKVLIELGLEYETFLETWTYDDAFDVYHATNNIIEENFISSWNHCLKGEIEMLKIDTRELIGQDVVASIGLNKEWVSYSEGNDGEEDYYRDVWVEGMLAYCDGESCKVEGINRKKETITLTNNEDNIFSIPFSQFEADFVITE